MYVIIQKIVRTKKMAMITTVKNYNFILKMLFCNDIKMM